MPRKRKKTTVAKKSRPAFHEKLKGFDIKVNSFGEMESTFDMDKLNSFLNEEVKDKRVLPSDGDEEE